MTDQETVVGVWKVPERHHETDVGDFHDLGIYPSGELMGVCESIEAAEKVVEHLEERSPSERFGDSMEDAPYEFSVCIEDVFTVEEIAGWNDD